MSATIVLEIFRYEPEKSDEPRFQSYEVPLQDDWVVLDAINYVKDTLDGTVSFRWSCRMGVCGSCGMMVNGDPVLTCGRYLKEFAPGPVRIEPLVHMPVIRDLVVDMDDFMDKLRAVKPWIIRDEEKPIEEGEHLQTPGQLLDFKQFTMCINCLLCYAACPIYGREVAFIGPAALALGHRYNQDSRDEGMEERAEVIAGPDGVWECTFVGDCSVACPKDVDPAGAIQQAKALHAAPPWIRTLMMPKGNK